jgi:glycosyltransferase involved in cell wall biosynthesis
MERGDCAGQAAALVVASLTLPPPINGQALVNACIATRLTQSPGRVRLINSSPKSSYRTIRYHFRRMVAVMVTLFVLAANARDARRRLYSVVEPGPGMLYNLLVVPVARLFGYTLFLHHHASSYTKTRDRRFALLCGIAGRETTHIALSDEMAQDLQALYRSCRRVIVAHNASHVFDPGGYTVLHRERIFTLGYLSNLSLEKGLDDVLRSYDAIRAAGLNARLVLAGPVGDASARDLIEKTNRKFGDAIVELGPVSGAAKHAFFEEIDVFLFPSRYRYEAQPLVVLEALSYGVPALVTRHGYVAEIVGPLNTATDASTFVVFATTFAEAWMRDPNFAATQRSAARARFEKLAEISRHQTSQLLSLLKGEGIAALTTEEAPMS